MGSKKSHNSDGQRDLFGEQPQVESEQPPSVPSRKKPAAPIETKIEIKSSLQTRAEQFHERLNNLIGEPTSLRITGNRTSLISFKRQLGTLNIRLHLAFLEAPDNVISDLVKWIKTPRNGSPNSVRLFAKNIPHPPVSESNRPHYTRTEANVHDLRILYDKVNEAFFGGKIDVKITYGRDSSRQRVRSRRLGSYSHRRKLITIHPLLDDPQVPEFIITFTIYHEMLHALQGEGHKRPHDSAFRKTEKSHPDYEKAMIWRQKHDEFLRGGVKRIATKAK